MSLENRKITTYEDNIKSLPDYPSDTGITAAQLKAMFDGRTDKEIKEKFNGLIDDLIALFAEIKNQFRTDIENHNESETAHEELFDEVEQFIISAVSDKVTEEEIETRLTPIEETLAEKADEEALLTKVDKVFGKGLSTNDFTNADKAVLDEAKDATERVNAHLADFNNPHEVTPNQIGLGNVANTKDEDKIVAIARECDFALLAEQAFSAELDYLGRIIHETYATKDEAGKVDLSGYYTKKESDEKFVGKDVHSADVSYLDGLITINSDRIDGLEEVIGNIDTAFDELHAYAETLIGGEQ